MEKHLHILRVFLCCKIWSEISVTVTIFGRWELPEADDVYFRNGSRNNTGAQAYNTYQ